MSKPNLVAMRDLVADRRERFSDEIFVRVGAVDFGGVEERDASSMGGANDLMPWCSVGGRAVVGADAHGASAQLRDLQRPSFRVRRALLWSPIACSARARCRAGQSAPRGLLFATRSRATECVGLDCSLLIHFALVHDFTVADESRIRLPDPPRFLPKMMSSLGTKTSASTDARLGSGSGTVELTDKAKRRSYRRDGSGDERPGARHSTLCPNRRRPQHRDSGAHAAPPPAPTEPLHCIYNLGLGVVAQGGKQVLVGERVDRLRPWAIHADDHRSARHLACHAGERARAVSRHDADAGPARSCSSLPRWTAPASRRDAAYRVHLVRSTRRRLARCARAARQAAGRAGSGSPAGAADPAGDHHPPADRSARPATAAPRHLGSPSQQIAKAVAWLKQNFVQPLRATIWRIART